MAGQNKVHRQMRNWARHFGFILLTISLVSCESEIEMADIVDKTAPFTLTIYHLSRQVRDIDTTESKEIETGTQKHKDFIDWTNRNTSGWTSSPATFLQDVSISQNNFKLLYDPLGFVVVSFLDKEGKSQQYTKEISPGELDFLIKD